MIAALAREFVLVYEAMALALGRAAALAHAVVQAARLRYLQARAG